MALNLLHSYRMHTSNPMPFALIAEENNEYTEEFDTVIIMNSPTRSYMDKLCLYDYIPFDEVIFVDADSLAYSDLNEWWDYFSLGSDFSGFGMCWEVEAGQGWFDPNNIGEYSGKVPFVPALQGGVYYLRKTDTCYKVFELAKTIAANYFDYGWTGFTDTPADEPILALSMAIHNCRSIMNMPSEGFSHVCNFPKPRDLSADIDSGTLFYNSNGKQYTGELIHWGNKRTRYSMYCFEVEKMEKVINAENRGIVYFLLYNCKIRYYILAIKDLKYFMERAKRRIEWVSKKYKK